VPVTIEERTHDALNVDRPLVTVSIHNWQESKRLVLGRLELRGYRVARRHGVGDVSAVEVKYLAVSSDACL